MLMLLYVATSCPKVVPLAGARSLQSEAWPSVESQPCVGVWLGSMAGQL